jgi:hypothetical protein
LEYAAVLEVVNFEDRHLGPHRSEEAPRVSLVATDYFTVLIANKVVALARWTPHRIERDAEQRCTEQ